jgi:hypothetical protein
MFTTAHPVPAEEPFENHIRQFALWAGQLVPDPGGVSAEKAALVKESSAKVLAALPPPPTPETL